MQILSGIQYNIVNGLTFSGQQRYKGKACCRRLISAYKNHNYFVSDNPVLVHNQFGQGWKGFYKGKLHPHFEKHGHEFGAITQQQYLNQAKYFANEVGNFEQSIVGDFMVKFAPTTRRVVIGHIKSRKIGQ